MDTTSVVGRLRAVNLPSGAAETFPSSGSLIQYAPGRARKKRRHRLAPLERPRSPLDAAAPVLRPPRFRGVDDAGYGLDAVEAALARRRKPRGRRRRRRSPDAARGRSRSRSSSPESFDPRRRVGATVDAALAMAAPALAWPSGAERTAYIEQLTSVERVRDSLPLAFLIATGQHAEVLRRRLSHVLRIMNRRRRADFGAAFARWLALVRYLQSRDFVARTIARARDDACRKVAALLLGYAARACRRHVRLWRRNARLRARAERRRLLNSMARRLQRWFRRMYLKSRGRKLLEKLRRKRRLANAAARAICRAEHLHAARAALLRRSRRLADEEFAAAALVQRNWHARMMRLELAARIAAARVKKETESGLVLARFWMMLKKDQSKTQRLGSRLSMWRERKLAAKKPKSKKKQLAQQRENKKAEMLRQLEARKRRAAQLKGAGAGPGEGIDQKDAAAMAAASMRATSQKGKGDASLAGAEDDAAAAMARAGGALASAAASAEEEEIRRLEEMLAHEEAMAAALAVDESEEEEEEDDDDDDAAAKKKSEEKPVMTEAQAACAVQTRIRTWNMRGMLAMKRAAHRAYWEAFYRHIERLREQAAASTIIKTWRKMQIYRSWKAADAAVAAAVAHLAELYLWELLSEAERQAKIEKLKATIFLQKAFRKKRARRHDWHARTAKRIQRAWRAHVARGVIRSAKATRDFHRKCNAAATTLFHFWHRTLQRRALAGRCEGEKRIRRHEAGAAASRAAAESLRRVYYSWRFRFCLDRRRDAVDLCDGARALRDRRSTLAARISKNYRRHWDATHFWLRSRVAEETGGVLGRHATRQKASRTLARHWFAMKWRYNQPIRIVARRRVAALIVECGEVVAEVVAKDAALVIRRAIRHRLDRDYLRRRFDAQRDRIAAAKAAADRLAGSETIQQAWLAYLERSAEAARRRALAAKLARVGELEAQEDACLVIQRCARCYLLNRLLDLRFQAARQRLDAAVEQRRRVDEARDERRDAEKAQGIAEAALTSVKLSGWKMGSDAEGANYYYNWVTGASQYDKPEGWCAPEADIWIRNIDPKGNVFYYNQDTYESAWFPPCSVCQKLEGKKICFTCDGVEDAHIDDGVFYCNDCFNESHDEELKGEHNWRGADADKEELGPGERHCLVCSKNKAEVTCKVCRDSYCNKCFKDKHSHGRLIEHPTIPFDEARRGWQEIKGRVEGEQTYYYHVSTGENRFDKPEEFMLDDELREHRNFKKFEVAAEKHCKRVDELQIEVERLQYDKDTTMFNLSKQQGAEHEELEELRRLLMAEMSKPTWYQRYTKIVGNPLRYYLEQREIRRRKRKLYRKMLLLNKRQREEAFHDGVFDPPKRSDREIRAAAGEKMGLNAKGAPLVGGPAGPKLNSKGVPLVS